MNVFTFPPAHDHWIQQVRIGRVNSRIDCISTGHSVNTKLHRLLVRLSSGEMGRYEGYEGYVTNDLSRGPPVPSLLDEPSQSLAAVLRANCQKCGSETQAALDE